MTTSVLSLRLPASPMRRAEPPRMFMSTRRAEPGGSIRLIVAGELDLAGRDHFVTALDAALTDSRRVLLDLGALTFIDCACLAGLFAAARRSRLQGGQLVLFDLCGQVRKLLDLVGAPPGVAILDRGDLPERPGAVVA